MPRAWHDKHALSSIEDQDEREMYRSLVADKKPYFMRYIYPALMRQYNTYIKNIDRNVMREFQIRLADLLSIDDEDLTDRQKEFLKFYKIKMPVGTNDCVMNRICRAFEKAFSEYAENKSQGKFDFSIMKSGTEYSIRQYRAVSSYYEEYNKRLADFAVYAEYERIDRSKQMTMIADMNEEFRAECSKICPDRFALCDILLDICYKKSSTKRFAWGMCGTEIIHNLLNKNNCQISYPIADDDGSFSYCGRKYSIETETYEVSE